MGGGESRINTLAGMREADLADAWAERRYDAECLVDTLGRRLQVVFPGRRWGGPGPDFRGALIALPDGTLVRGDVEVHRRSSGWLQHGHGANPAYANVVLHVVAVDDAAIATARGRPVPAVVLPLRQGLAALPLVAPCRASRTSGELLDVVEAAGLERFRGRAARFEGDLAAVGADQTLWRGVAEALGYSQNVQPFARLADAVPWPAAAASAGEAGGTGLAALLLGSAGLLADCSLEEQDYWIRLEREGARPHLAAASWSRSAIRPANDPVVRCRALAALAVRWAATENGPAETVLSLVAAAGEQPRPRLEQVAQMSPGIGAGRARTLIVNVILPFAAAAGVACAEQLYRRIPGEPLNRPIQYMAAELGVSTRRFSTACHRQGLIQLFRTRCENRRCEVCPAASLAPVPLTA